MSIIDIFKRIDQLSELKKINSQLEELNNSNAKILMLHKVSLENQNIEMLKLTKTISENSDKQKESKTNIPQVPNSILQEILLLLDYIIMNTDAISKRKYDKLKKRLNNV